MNFLKWWLAPKRLIPVFAVLICCGVAVAYFAGRSDGDDSGPKKEKKEKQKKGKKNKNDDGVLEDWVERQRAMDPDGEGFLVWTSNRSGIFRVWRSGLDGTGTKMISPDEAGKAHVAPHISPDGKQVAFFSGTEDGRYSFGPVYALRVMSADGGGMRELAPKACLALGGFRSVVWMSPEELIYLDEESRAVRLNIDTGERQLLTGGGRYMLNRQLTHAFDRYFFHRYDPTASEVIRSGTKYGGCEAYFTHDGRWGLRMNGAGGPISRVDLATGDVVNLLESDDERMPTSRNYMYFPMVSRCNRLIAFGASRNRHDHSTSDYDIFVARIDPETLLLTSDPIRYTFDPGTDRYPDIFLAELPLGRYSVEVPATVKFFDKGTVGGGAWEYDGGEEVSPGIARFDKPGVYEIQRTFAGKTERGKVTVKERKAPKPVSVDLRSRRILEVVFDEGVDGSSALASMESGIKVKRIEESSSQRVVVLELESEFTEAADKLSLSGVVDLAQEPNAMEPTTLIVKRPTWPSDPASAAFVWESVEGVKRAAGSASSVTAQMRAQVDRLGRLDVNGGSFVADSDSSKRALTQAKGRGEFSIEAVIFPSAEKSVTEDKVLPIVSLGTGKEGSNFILGQRGERLILDIQDSSKKRRELDLCALEANRSQHVVVTYGENNAVCYLDGKKVFETPGVAADFSTWQSGDLIFGSGDFENKGWSGKLDGLAFYGRAIGASDVVANFGSVSDRLKKVAADNVQSTEVEVELVAKAEVPTLDEIAPYREGLFVCEFKVTKVLGGSLDGVTDGDNFRAALWAIQDNKVLPVTGAKAGDTFTLQLEPFDAQKQLKSHFKKDLQPFSPMPLMFVLGQR